MDPEAFLPLHPKDYLILFALVPGQKHGYGIVKEVERESRGAVSLDPANLYRSIKRMIRDGLVIEAGRNENDVDEESRRRYFAITELGRRVVMLEATRLAELADAARAQNLIGGSGSRR